MSDQNEKEEEIEPSPVYLGNELEKYKNNPLNKFSTHFKVSTFDSKDLDGSRNKRFVDPVASDLKTLNHLYDMCTAHRDTANLKILHMF